SPVDAYHWLPQPPPVAIALARRRLWSAIATMTEAATTTLISHVDNGERSNFHANEQRLRDAQARADYGTFNLINRLTLDDLAQAIERREAEKSWTIYNTLTSLFGASYIPFELHSKLYSLLVYVQRISKSGTSVHTQEEIDLLLFHIEGLGYSRTEFMSAAVPVPIPPYKPLRYAIVNGDPDHAWRAYTEIMSQPSGWRHLSKKINMELVTLLASSPNHKDSVFVVAQNTVDVIKRTISSENDALSAETFVFLSQIHDRLKRNDLDTCERTIDSFVASRPPKGLGGLDGYAFNELVRMALGNGQVVLAHRLFNKMALIGIPATAQTYAILMLGYAKIHRVDLGLDVFKRMYNDCVVPDLKTFNALLCLLARGGETEKVVTILKYMTDAGIEPDVVSYSEAIKVFASVPDLARCVEFVETMQQRDVLPNEYTYSILIDAHARQKDIHGAIHWFQQMLVANLCPNVVTISSLVKALASTPSQMSKTMTLYEEARQVGIRPDVILYTLLIKIHARAMDLDASLALHASMLRDRLQPTVYTYTALIDACAKNAKLETAVQLFKLMAESDRFKPNTHTYCAMMDAYAKHGRLDMVESTFTELLERGRMQAETGAVSDVERIERSVGVDTATLNCLMEAYNRAGEGRKVVEVYERLFTRFEVRPDAWTVSIMLDSCGYNDMPDEGLRILYKSGWATWTRGRVGQGGRFD
ncbi:hypothetical protein BC936DRAFT_141828, partial [Jimgerdemannia flammicorona]